MSSMKESHAESVTRKIKDTLLNLLAEKDIRQITIKEITEEAGVSRGSLYFHYEDKFEVFEEIIEEKKEGLRKAILDSLKDGSYINLHHMNLRVHPTLSFVSENKAFFRTMIDRNKMPYVNFHRFFIDIFNKEVVLSPLNVPLSPLEQELYTHYRALYTYAIILYWINEGVGFSPEQISQEFWELISEKRFYWIFGNSVKEMEDKEHVDRRVLRTRQGLKEALSELILETKNYSAVTISNITRKSDIRRATFYDHYTDKDALFKEIIEDFCRNLINIFTIEERTENYTVAESEKVLVKLFTYLTEHLSVVHFINADYGIPDPIPEIIGCLSKFYLKQDITLKASKDMYAYYVSGMIIGLAIFWTHEGKKHSPEFLAKEFIQFLDLKKYKITLL
ncbi:transcriptional regulator, TetR family [Bacillus sp. OV166]|uniref:TetR/AcrR family transcriptional regulator n=1 Tax=Bacillus sp. OV166 TaxID=1882763 RepID=UPI000A2AD40F|nr:TetR/AcrR family transcriptional regulator [Bacillus sp. OV166]SMQ87036.1 transcriptional regulator, TetR family [Bacillus sp. OV166]